MTESQRQSLSRWIDGDLPAGQARRLIPEAGDDTELRGAWERYHLIGQALRGERIDLAPREVADRVLSALDAGADLARDAEDTRARRGLGRHLWPVAHLLRRESRPTARRRWHPRALTGTALAASLAAVAVLALPAWYRSTPSPVAPAPLFVAAVAPAPATLPRWHLDRPEVAKKLDRYLVNHQEAMPVSATKGMLHYATFVAYDPRR